MVGGRRFPWDQEGGDLKSGCSMFPRGRGGGRSTPVLKSEQAGEGWETGGSF